MMRYIGIQGYRGAGKDAWAFLLGTILNYLLSSENNNESLDMDNVDKLYDDAVEAILCNTQFIQDSKFSHVYLASFSDTPKTLLHLMTNIPVEYMYDSEYKISTYVNTKTFEYVEGIVDPSELNIVTAKELWNKQIDIIQHKNTPLYPTPLDDEWIQLKELLMYYAHFVMKNFLGQNIWVKSLETTEEEDEYYMPNDSYKIFNDIKFHSEEKYIRSKGGVIIYIDRPQNRKVDYVPIEKVLNPDYTIRLETDSLEGLNSLDVKHQVIELALSIYTLNWQ